MRARTSSFLVFTFIALIFLPARGVSAQDRVAISGRLADASDAVVPGATIDAIVADRRFATTISNADGAYRIEVPAGVPLSLRVTLAGFAEQTIALPGQHRDTTRDLVLTV